MSNQSDSHEHRKLEELLKEVLTRVIDTWISGEGDISIEIRDGGNEKIARIMGGATKRIK
jgi:hypothetical protein